jgi:hypothetical protein
MHGINLHLQSQGITIVFICVTHVHTKYTLKAVLKRA